MAIDAWVIAASAGSAVAPAPGSTAPGARATVAGPPGANDSLSCAWAMASTYSAEGASSAGGACGASTGPAVVARGWAPLAVSTADADTAAAGPGRPASDTTGVAAELAVLDGAAGAAEGAMRAAATSRPRVTRRRRVSRWVMPTSWEW